MIQAFYEIRENKETGGFIYHEFKSGWSGYYAYAFDDIWKNFATRTEAQCYALYRGAANAYF